MLVLDATNEVTRWVGGIVGIDDFGPCSAIGVLRRAELVAGAVFHQYRPRNADIEITFASTTPRWATRDAITGIMRYPFVQLDCRRLTAITSEHNLAAREFLSRFGFTLEGYHPEALPTGAAISYGLLRRDCRWLMN